MTYEQQNKSIRKEIKDIDQQIENIQRIYSEVLFKADQFYSRSKAQWAMSEKLKSLESRREFLLEKLKESPEQRKVSNLKENIWDGIWEITKTLPDLQHIGGNVYIDRNGGCGIWCLIITVIGLVVLGIMCIVNY